MSTKLRRFVALLSALVLVLALSVTAYAGGGPEYPVRENQTENTYPERDTSTQKPVASAPLTPSGNLTLVDDILQTSPEHTGKEETGADASENAAAEPENKQFITVQSKNGNYFYLVIDRSGETENVYFLNLVDESDLLALIETEDGEEMEPVCSCSDKCVIGAIKIDCEICAYNISDCAGVEPEPIEPEEPEAPVEEPMEEPEKPDENNNALIMVVLLAVFGAGGFVLYKKYIQPKKQAAQRPDPDAFDYDDPDDEEEEL